MCARVLLAGDELTGTLAATRALAAAGHRVVLAVSVPDTFAARSRTVDEVVTVPDPDYLPDAFVEALGEVARTRAVDVVLPGHESSLVLLAGCGGVLEGAAVGAPPPEIVARATDKAQVLATAQEVGLATPPTALVRADEVAALAESLRLPAIAKPLRTKLPLASGRLVYFKARRVETAAELHAVLRALPEEQWQVQPYLEGTLTAISGVSWRGELVSALHQRARRIWPPDAGFSAYAETVPADREREQRLATLLARLEWSGVYEAQFLATSEGRYLIDLNPRIYGSLSLAVRAGHNLPAIWVDLLLERRPVVEPYRVGVRYRFEQNDARALAASFRRGAVKEAAAGLLPRRRTTHAVFSWRDPQPMLVTLAKLRRRLG